MQFTPYSAQFVDKFYDAAVPVHLSLEKLVKSFCAAYYTNTTPIICPFFLLGLVLGSDPHLDPNLN
jgi:hypothetical protein